MSLSCYVTPDLVVTRVEERKEAAAKRIHGKSKKIETKKENNDSKLHGLQQWVS